MAPRVPLTEIGIVVYPGAQLAAVHGLSDLFSIANGVSVSQAGPAAPRLAVSHWSPDRAGGFAGAGSDGRQGARRPDILITPPTMMDLPSGAPLARIVRLLREHHARGTLLVCVCSGVVLLAETGLIDGRTVSTHRGYSKHVAERYPAVRLDVDSRIIEYPDLLTAGGFLAWVDVGLLLVQRLLGESVREETARFMLSEPPEAEGSDPGRFLPPLAHGDAAIRRAQQHVHLNDGLGVTLASMAEAAQLGRRTLLRRFTKATGLTPMAYCRAVRMARAREMLDAGDVSQGEIAERLGYIDANSFSRAFRKVQGVPPGTYRRQYGGAYAAERPGPSGGGFNSRRDAARDSHHMRAR